VSAFPNETPRERLRVAFDLIDTAERMLRQRLRREVAGITDEEIEARVAAWYAKRPGAELGDADGVCGAWPRR